MSDVLINLYDDELSELILDEELFSPTTTDNFWNLGEIIDTANTSLDMTRERYCRF